MKFSCRYFFCLPCSLSTIDFATRSRNKTVTATNGDASITVAPKSAAQPEGESRKVEIEKPPGANTPASQLKTRNSASPSPKVARNMTSALFFGEMLLETIAKLYPTLPRASNKAGDGQTALRRIEGMQKGGRERVAAQNMCGHPMLCNC